MRSVRPRVLIPASVLLAFACIAHAEDIDVWNFRGDMPKSAGANGLTDVHESPEGLVIRTDTDGYVAWPDHPLGAPAEVLTLTAKSAVPMQAVFMWQPVDGGEGLYQLPFVIPASENGASVDVVLSDYPMWDWRTDTVALRFPAGADVTLVEMDFRHWSPMEKFIEGWKSFWTFDDFRAYSINFLWGPLIAGNPVARANLYATLPPFAWSALRVMYAILAVVGVIAVAARVIARDRALALGIFAAAFAGCWLFFDLRMGLEIVSYAKDDWRSYVLQSPDDRRLRTHDNLYAIIDRILPTIQAYDRYALYSPVGSVIYPNLRYAAYPSVPVLNPSSSSGVQLNVIMGAQGMYVDELGRLARVTASGSGEVLSAPGHIVQQINENAFLFVTDR